MIEPISCEEGDTERIRGFYRWTVASVNSDGDKCKDFQSTWLSVSLNVMIFSLVDSM